MSTVQVVVKKPGAPAYTLVTGGKVMKLATLIGIEEYEIVPYELMGNSAHALVRADRVPTAPISNGPVMILHRIPGGGIDSLTDEEARNWKFALNLSLLEREKKASRSKWGGNRRRTRYVGK